MDNGQKNTIFAISAWYIFHIKTSLSTPICNTQSISANESDTKHSRSV